MPFRQAGSIRLFEFETLSNAGLVQAVFTRRGGRSPEPWASLNVGGTVGDERSRVDSNIERCFDAVGREAASCHDVWQSHSSTVVFAESPRAGRDRVRADILISNNPEVTLFMRFADCVPIFLFDPIARAIGLAHAGWLGTVRKAAGVAVRAMVERHGSRPADILAAIGPSICREHYPIGPEVVDQVRQAFGDSADEHLPRSNGATHLDLWSANTSLLKSEGVESIEVCGICTAAHPEDWYSHRGERGRTGRFCAVFALEWGDGG
jgi:YfiH family protein